MSYFNGRMKRALSGIFKMSDSLPEPVHTIDIPFIVLIFTVVMRTFRKAVTPYIFPESVIDPCEMFVFLPPLSP